MRDNIYNYSDMANYVIAHVHNDYKDVNPIMKSYELYNF